jgi:hypothetical protein
LRGQSLFASDGEEIGVIETVLYDQATGKREWLAVRTSPLGVKSLLPYKGAEERAAGVWAPYSKSQIESAPQLEGTEISQEDERALASHFGLAYSERRSPSGLAEGRTPAKGRRTAVGGRTRRGRRSDTSPAGRRSEGPTREELYEQAKRMGIKGRSKMNKSQLARAVGRSSGQAASGRAAKANPVEVQTFLEGVGYPTGKRELVREAKRQGAHQRVYSTLERLPDDEFDSPAAVSEAIGQLS